MATNGSDGSTDEEVGKVGVAVPKPSSGGTGAGAGTGASDGGKDVGSSYRLWFAALTVISVTSLILSITLPLTVGRSSASSSSSQSSATGGGGGGGTSSSRQEAVLAGVGSFRVEAGLLGEKVRVLASALAAGDLEQARQAYAFSRASYEQIEVLAAAFPDTDCNLDCRPYAYDYGDYDPKYYGFHRIEAHLFRDSNATAALAFAKQMQDDTANLQKELAEDGRFSEAITWGGMLGLAREIAYKKISGEEEAYSGLSLLIFHENYNGIQSQYMPFHDHVMGANPGAAREAAEALDEAKMHLQSYHDASVAYGVWTQYKDLDEYDRKTIYDNAMRVVTALEAAAEALEIQFDAGEEEGGPEEVTVPEGFDSLVAESVAALHGLAEQMVTSATALLGSVESGDLAAARAAYETSRHEYEQIEVFANSFPEVDSDIDARPYSFGMGEADEAFKGFHKIERSLFRDHDMTLAATVASGLVESANQLVAALEDASAFNVLLAFEGMIGLALEIAAKKISGEEETFSNLSVLIFEKNWEGISTVFAPFAASPTYGNLTSVLSTTAALDRCRNVTAAIASDSSIPVAFAGSDTPSFNHLPSDTYLQDIVLATHGLATALVDVADDFGLFPSPHKFNRESFPRTGFE